MIKKSLFAIAALLAGLGPLRAELPPSAYEQMQSRSPEVLRIHVLRVSSEPVNGEASAQEVTMLAEVLKVGRSQTRLKASDMITIRYRIVKREPGWVGPGEVPILKEDAESVAYLAPIAGTQDYAPAAGAMSFSHF